MPRLSVISGAYNLAHTAQFKKSIESVLTQSFSDFEFIICDDGSTDRTFEILKEYAKKDSRIKLLKNEKNLTLAPTLNRCIKESEGEYIARHDLDDLSERERFEKQLCYLDSHPKTAILGTAAYLFDERGVFGREHPPKKVEKKDFLFNNPYKHGSVILRRTALARAGGYCEAKWATRNEDYELFMKIHGFADGANLEDALYGFCEDRLAKRRRKYRYRINEAIVRARGFRLLGLMPRALPYVIKPLIVGLIPSPLLSELQSKRRKQ